MSVSNPLTPPSRAPNRDERRFNPIAYACEWIEEYRPGGFHPVHLGDVFSDGRYKVIRKLGEGSFSTVWLARDLREEIYVALKIMVSNPSGFPGAADELQILRHISRIAPTQTARYITQPLDHFEHPGPNGLHNCLVFEPMGPTVNSMVEELPQFKPRYYDTKIRYPPTMARAIPKQSLEALTFLHGNGIAHGDFHSGNILFSLDNIDSKTEDLLRQDESAEADSISPPVQRLDGKEDRWAPRYLCVGQPLAAFTNYTNDLKIKLSDMGGSYFFSHPPTKPIIPTGLRAPEWVLSGAVNNTFDVWSFGCLVFELITGWPLFCVPWSKSQTEVDDGHLLQLTDRLGPLPEELYRQWKTSSLYFTPERKPYNCEVGGVKEGAEPLMLEQHSIEEYFDQSKPDVNDEEATKIKLLIRRILQYDPTKRPSAGPNFGTGSSRRK
ncbi:serine protein kinase [Xylaria digitata]|nr:serine protein kinase [Xylaria digitata]